MFVGVGGRDLFISSYLCCSAIAFSFFVIGRGADGIDGEGCIVMKKEEGRKEKRKRGSKRGKELFYLIQCNIKINKIQ